MKKKTVVVGMSGGVDSSVSALLLKEAGYSVIALFMKNWEEKDLLGTCSSAADFEDVEKVCRVIGIPHYTVNFTEEYKDHVFSHFLEELKKGRTPNPDILCNREIKFNLFLKKALDLGADYLATGHYCQTIQKEGETFLARGLDVNKDQSYFLHAVSSKALEKTLFPVGHLEKSEVRRIAKENNLPTAAKKDSTGICFIGERNFTDFIHNYLPYKEGKLCTLDGKVIGSHKGVAFYTIGQRKGLSIGGPGEPWFVAKKDNEKNIIYVVQGENDPALFTKSTECNEITWVNQNKTPTFPLKCTAKVRYRAKDAACEVFQIASDRLKVVFDKPERAVTPGQAIVFYLGEICLGGAVIV